MDYSKVGIMNEYVVLVHLGNAERVHYIFDLLVALE